MAPEFLRINQEEPCSPWFFISGSAFTGWAKTSVCFQEKAQETAEGFGGGRQFHRKVSSGGLPLYDKMRKLNLFMFFSYREREYVL